MASIHEAVGTQQELVLERMDVRQTAKILGAMVGYLEAEETIRIAKGIERESKLFKSVRQEHERVLALVEQSSPGVRETFLNEHSPQFHVYDGIFDCSSQDCPNIGYKSGEDVALHLSMWGFDNPIIDIRYSSEEL